jgi:hypothetical protein
MKTILLVFIFLFSNLFLIAQQGGDSMQVADDPVDSFLKLTKIPSKTDQL